MVATERNWVIWRSSPTPSCATEVGRPNTQLGRSQCGKFVQFSASPLTAIALLDGEGAGLRVRVLAGEAGVADVRHVLVHVVAARRPGEDAADAEPGEGGRGIRTRGGGHCHHEKYDDQRNQ